MTAKEFGPGGAYDERYRWSVRGILELGRGSALFFVHHAFECGCVSLSTKKKLLGSSNKTARLGHEALALYIDLLA